MSPTPDHGEDIAKTLHPVSYFLSAAYSACVTVELALERQGADHDLDFGRADPTRPCGQSYRILEGHSAGKTALTAGIRGYNT